MSDDAFQAPSPEYLAELLPQYDIEFFIAQGGMGAVYKGCQISLERDIAIKVLSREMGESQEFRDSFTSEAKAMARLNHPNLLSVFDYGNVEGMPYIVMEYVEGGSLHQAAWEQAVEPSQAVAIVKGICDGLAHAHEHGIVHRDIKPSNILLTPTIEPKVADFGLAHAADSDTPGLVMGTPGYTAPEVFQDPSQAGKLADIYSVGVILHQLLTGIDPAGSMGPPTQPTGNIRLDAIWRKATHAIPSQRYPDIVSLGGELGKWLDAKKKAPVVTNAAPLNSPRRPVQVQTGGGDAGSGVLVKLVLIGILGGVVVFTYQLLQERKEDINKGISDINGENDSATVAPEPVPVTPPEKPVTLSLPSDDDKPMDSIDPETFHIPDRNRPVIVADVDDEPEPEPVEELPPGDPELRQRAVGLILDARKKRDKEFADNASALHFALSAQSRGAEKDVVSLVEKLKADIVDDRIPLIDDVSGLPEKIAGAFTDCLAKEESIDERYRADLTRIRDAYVSRLQGAADEAADDDLKKRLLAQAERAGDLDSWIGLLSPEPERVVRRSSGGLAGGFTGNWDIHSEGKVKRWTAHPDGRMEIVGKDWEAFWEILEDGTLEVRWTGKKRPYKLTRDGEDWSGESPFGHPVTFKRGDW